MHELCQHILCNTGAQFSLIRLQTIFSRSQDFFFWSDYLNAQKGKRPALQNCTAPTVRKIGFPLHTRQKKPVNIPVSAK